MAGFTFDTFCEIETGDRDVTDTKTALFVALQTRGAVYRLAPFHLSRTFRAMRFPNLRYGNPLELRYYLQGAPLAEFAKRLRRSERTVQDWASGKVRVPFWVPELLRLQNMERDHMLRQMNFRAMAPRLGIVRPSGTLHSLSPRLAPIPAAHMKKPASMKLARAVRKRKAA